TAPNACSSAWWPGGPEFRPACRCMKSRPKECATWGVTAGGRQEQLQARHGVDDGRRWVGRESLDVGRGERHHLGGLRGDLGHRQLRRQSPGQKRRQEPGTVLRDPGVDLTGGAAIGSIVYRPGRAPSATEHAPNMRKPPPCERTARDMPPDSTTITTYAA